MPLTPQLGSWSGIHCSSGGSDMARCIECGKRIGIFSKPIDGLYCSTECSDLRSPAPSRDPILFDELLQFQRDHFPTYFDLEEAPATAGFWVLRHVLTGRSSFDPKKCVCCGEKPRSELELIEERHYREKTPHGLEDKTSERRLSIPLCVAHSEPVVVGARVGPESTDRGQQVIIDESEQARFLGSTHEGSVSFRLPTPNTYIFTDKSREQLILAMIKSPIGLDDRYGFHWIPRMNMPTWTSFLLVPNFYIGRVVLERKAEKHGLAPHYWQRGSFQETSSAVQKTREGLLARILGASENYEQICPFCGSLRLDILDEMSFSCQVCSKKVIDCWIGRPWQKNEAPAPTM